MSINYLAVIIATVAQFIIGGIWYMPIFGKLWGKIHGMESLTPEQRSMMQKGMWPLLVAQLIATLVTTVVLAIFITYLPADWNVYALAGLFWIGFVVPTQVGAVLFGGTKPEWVITKIAIMAGASIICLEVAATILKAMM